VFLGEVASDFVSSEALAGEHEAEFRVYMRDYVLEDPIGRAALTSKRRVLLFDEMIEKKALRTSRAYLDFHRHHDFEHHLMIRIYGERLPAPGALVLGLTRGKRQGPFGQAEARIAHWALPAFLGAAQRIQHASRAQLPSADAAGAARLHEVARARGLTRAETDVLASLVLGLTNSGIARRLCISVETVKTHLYRVFRKLGVRSRTEALVFVSRQ
jgi:DNA-binding CsgD family transcriptional regulator